MYNKTTSIRIFIEAEVSLLRPAKTCLRKFYLEQIHRYCSIDQPSVVQKKHCFQGLKPTPSSSPVSVDLYGRVVTHNARFVKGWHEQRWMNGYADCSTRDANIISYIDENPVPRERFRGANDNFAFIAQRCIVQRVKKVFLYLSE